MKQRNVPGTAVGERTSDVRDLKEVFFAPTWKKEYLVVLRVFTFSRQFGEKIKKFRMNAIASSSKEAVRRASTIAKELYPEFYRIEEVETVVIENKE